MADPLSVASSLVAVTVFALQSSTSLAEVVRKFRSNSRRIREFKEELEKLTGVVGSLNQMILAYEAELRNLRVPLLQCGKNCKGFEEVIDGVTKHSDGKQLSFRDWEKLQYMRGDTTSFRLMLREYRATFNIVIASVTMYVSLYLLVIIIC